MKKGEKKTNHQKIKPLEVTMKPEPYKESGKTGLRSHTTLTSKEAASRNI